MSEVGELALLISFMKPREGSTIDLEDAVFTSLSLHEDRQEPLVSVLCGNPESSIKSLGTSEIDVCHYPTEVRLRYHCTPLRLPRWMSQAANLVVEKYTRIHTAVPCINVSKSTLMDTKF